MDICVITGASSGFGKIIAKGIKEHIKVDEIWLIARRKNILNELQNELDIKSKVIPLDLTLDESLNKYNDLLNEFKPNIKYLFNVSGYGTFGEFSEIDIDKWNNMIDLNIKSVVNMTYYSLKYMNKDSHIINISSMSAFAPLPYLSVYAATKSFVLSFSRAINKELKNDKIHVHALCPYWSNTNFINVAKSENDSLINHFDKIYDPVYVINYMWKKVKKNKDVIIPGKHARFISRLEKFLPHSFIMNRWIKSQKNIKNK